MSAWFAQFLMTNVLAPRLTLPTIPLTASLPLIEPLTVTFSTVMLPLEYPTRAPTESALAFAYLS